MQYPLRKRDWHYAPGPRGVPQTQTDDDPSQHGSCVASKAAGASYGVARESRLSILKTTDRASHIRWALFTARDDIMANGRRGKSVVVLAKSNSDVGKPTDGEWPFIRSHMTDLFNMDVVVVNSGGNKANKPGRLPCDTVPQLWEASNFPLIVAGAVDNTGLQLPSSQRSNYLPIWAPGANVGCVKGQYTYGTGTSFSAAVVSRFQGQRRDGCATLADIDI